MTAMVARFGSFEADEERFELRLRGEVVPVRRRVLDTILFLSRSGGRLVTRRDLIAGPWQGTTVSDAAISQAVMHARRALLDPERPHLYVVTVRGKGFRWDEQPAAPAERHDPPAPWAAGPPSAAPRDRRPARRAAAKSAPVGGRALLDGLRASRRLLARTRRARDPIAELGTLLACMEPLFALGRTAELDRLARRHRRLTADVDHPGHLWFAAVLEAARQFHAGRVARAARLLRRNLRVGRRALGPAADAIVSTHLLNLALEVVGRTRRALLRQAAALATRAAARGPAFGPILLVVAVARLHLGDQRGARRLLHSRRFDAAVLPGDRDLLPALVNLTDLALAFHDRRRLDAIYRRLAAHVGLRVCRDFADWGPVAYHLARAARGLGLDAEGRRLTRLAVAHTRRAVARPWTLWAARAQALALLDGGGASDRRRAVALLARTQASARALGLTALARATSASLAGALRTNRPGGDRAR